MTMLMKIFNDYKRLYFTDPLSGFLKQKFMKTCLSKLVSEYDPFSVKFLRTILLDNCHSSPLNTTGYLLKSILI